MYLEWKVIKFRHYQKRPNVKKAFYIYSPFLKYKKSRLSSGFSLYYIFLLLHRNMLQYNTNFQYFGANEIKAYNSELLIWKYKVVIISLYLENIKTDFIRHIHLTW
jgi:hypothetical protein